MVIIVGCGMMRKNMEKRIVSAVSGMVNIKYMQNICALK